MDNKNHRSKLPDAVDKAFARFNFPLLMPPARGGVGDAVKRTGARLVGIGRMVEALGKAFPQGAKEPSVTQYAISITVQLERTFGLFTGHSVSEILDLTAKQLQANVDSGDPKPHTQALTHKEFVPLLKLVSQYHQEGDPAPGVSDETGEHLIPILDQQDFDEPPAEDVREQSDTFQAHGIRITSKGVVELLFSSSFLAVRVGNTTEKQALAWPCSTFRNGVFVEGTITRDDDNVWHLKDGAKVVFCDSLPQDGVEPETAPKSTSDDDAK